MVTSTSVPFASEGVALPLRREKKGSDDDSSTPSLLPTDPPFGDPPSDSPSGSPASEPKKRRSFGRKKPKEGEDFFGPEPPMLGDSSDPWSRPAPSAATEDDDADPDLDPDVDPDFEEDRPSPWATDEPVETVAPPETGRRAPRPRPTARPSGRPSVPPSGPPPSSGPPPAAPSPWDEPAEPAFEPDEVPEPSAKPQAPPRTTPAAAAVPPPSPWGRPSTADHDEHELEFVFAGGGGGSSGLTSGRKRGRDRAPKGERAPKQPKAPKPPKPPSERKISRPTLIAIAVLLLLVLGVAAYALLFSDDDIDPVPTSPPVATADATPEPTTAPVALSEECANAFLFAEARRDDPANLTRTGDLCRTTDEWLAAAAQYPGAIGAASASDVGTDDLASFCGNSPTTAVCQDASNKGLFGGGSPAATSPQSPA